MASNSNDRNIGNDNNTKINYNSLNEKQKKVFKTIEKYYNDIILGQQVKPLKIVVMEIASTEKSYLIKAIRNWLHTMVREDGKSSVLVIALIKVVIFNINELTIHSTFSILIINDKKYELSSICLKQL